MESFEQDKSQKKIRVLLTVPHLASSASPYRGMMAIAKYLPKDRFDLTICSLRRNGIEETGPLLDEMGIPYFIARYRIKHPRELLKFIRDNRLIKRNGPFAIQHSFDFTTSPVETIIARLSGRVFIHQQRNMNENGHLLLLKLRIFLSHKVIAISRGVKAFLLANGIAESKVELIHNGMEVVDEPIAKNVSNEIMINDKENNYPKLLMVSHLIPRKKIENAIEVVLQLIKKYPKILLQIIGLEYDQKYKDTLRENVDKNQLNENVKFLGNLKNQDVLKTMAHSDIFLHCAESEAFGWVIVEAFSQKLPVVAAKSEGAIEIIEHGRTGFLYDAGNIVQLRENIEYLIEHQAFREEIAESAYNDLLERFSTQAMVEKISRIYQDVLKS